MIQRLLLIFVMIVLTSCSGGQVRSSKTLKVRSDQALLTVYLSTSGSAEMDIRVRIEEVELDVGGVWIGLGLDSLEVDYLKLKGDQVLLGAAIAPLGKHRRLRLRCSGLPPEAGGTAEAEQTFTVVLAGPLDLRQGESKCLFVDWRLVEEQPGSKKLSSRFTAWGQGQILGGELLYVACRDLNTIYVARIDINQVMAAFAVPGPLGDLQLSAGQRRLYVLSTGRRTIYVYDSLSARLLDQIALPGSIAPRFMTLSAEGRYAFVTDSAAGAVFKVSLNDGHLVAHQRLGYDPQRLIYIAEGQGSLAVVTPRSQQVFILNAEDLEVQRSIPVGARPSGVLYFDRSLYVAESGTDSVAIFNVLTGAQAGKIAVGSRPGSLLAVDSRTAYVGNAGETSLSALVAGQKTAFRRISITQQPGEMIFSQRKRLLYVASPASGLVVVVDPFSEKVVRYLDFAGIAESMTILE